MENLYVDGIQIHHLFGMKMSRIHWLDLLLLITAVKNLYSFHVYSLHIPFVLQELSGQVLSALRSTFLDGLQPLSSFLTAIEKFSSARQFTNHPVAISVWHRDGCGTGGRRSMIDSCPSSDSLTFRVGAVVFSLWLLRYWLHRFVEHVILYPCNDMSCCVEKGPCPQTRIPPSRFNHGLPPFRT